MSVTVLDQSIAFGVFTAAARVGIGLQAALIHKEYRAAVITDQNGHVAWPVDLTVLDSHACPN